LETLLATEKREKIRITEEFDKAKLEITRLSEIELKFESFQRSHQMTISKLETSHQVRNSSYNIINLNKPRISPV
jgi:hypothetical protein